MTVQFEIHPHTSGEAVTRNLAVARTVAHHATGPADARMLLAMLGLIGDDGRLAPDGPHRADATIHPPGGKGIVRTVGATTRPKMSTAPEALRNLPAVINPAKANKPAVVKPTPTPRTVVKHGTDSGYMRHLRTTKDTPCQRCRAAHAAANGKPSRRKVAECGTHAAYTRHLNNGETACDPCKAAHTLQNQKYERPGRNHNAIQAAKSTATCGTVQGYWVHKKRGEESCRPCLDASAAHSRERRAERNAEGGAA